MNINIEPGKYGYKILVLLIGCIFSKRILKKASEFSKEVESNPKPPSTKKKKKVNNNSS